MNAVEIYHELCMVNGQNVKSEGTVGQWCKMFRDGQKNVHNEERSDQPSVVNDNLVQSVDEKFMKDSSSQFQNFHVNSRKFQPLPSTRLSQTRL
jgi:hypothetical protein